MGGSLANQRLITVSLGYNRNSASSSISRIVCGRLTLVASSSWLNLVERFFGQFPSFRPHGSGANSR